MAKKYNLPSAAEIRKQQARATEAPKPANTAAQSGAGQSIGRMSSVTPNKALTRSNLTQQNVIPTQVLDNLQGQQQAAMDRLNGLYTEASYTTTVNPDLDRRIADARAELDGIRSQINQIDPTKAIYTDAERVANTLKGGVKTGAADTGNAFLDLANWLAKGQAYSMDPNQFLAHSLTGGDAMAVQQSNIDFYNSPEQQAKRDAAYERMDALSLSGQQDIAHAKQNASRFQNFLVDAGVAGVQLLGDAALAAINPLYSTAAMGARAFGGSTREARQAGASELEQLLTGGANAAVSIGLGKLFDGLAGVYGGGLGDDAVEGLVRRLANTDRGRTVARFLLNALGEGTEEFAEGAVEPLLNAIYDDGARLREVYSSPEAWADALVDNLYSGLIGATLGAAGGAVNIASGRDAVQNEQLRLEDAMAALGIEEQLEQQEQENRQEKPQEVAEKQGDTPAPPEPENADTPLFGELNNGQEEQAPQTNDDDFGMPDTDAVLAFMRGESDVNPLASAAPEQVTGNEPNEQNPFDIFQDTIGIRPEQAANEQGAEQGLGEEVRQADEDAAPAEERQETAPVDGAPLQNPEPASAYSGAPITPKQVNSAGGSREVIDARARGLSDEEIFRELGEAHGVMPQGEKAVRDAAMPGTIGDGRKVSQSARTIYEANATPESRLGELRTAVLDGKLSYVPVTNAELGNAAAAEIQREGWSRTYRNWATKVASGGKSDPKLVAMGAQLLNNAANNPECSARDYIDLVMDYKKLTSGTAQSLAAARLLKNLSPEGKLYAITRSIESIRAEAEGKYELKIDESLIDKYREQTTDEGRDAVIDEIQEDIARQIPTTFLEAMNALSYLNMLGNLKTQLRNVAGNAVSLVGRKIKDGVKQLLELSKPQEQRTASLFYSKQLAAEAKTLYDADADEILGESKFSDFGKQFDKGVQDKHEVFAIHSDWGKKPDSNAAAKAARWIADKPLKGLEAYRKATNIAMEQGDLFFAKIVYVDALAGFLQARGIKSISEASEATLDEARAYAINQARETTFRDSNDVSNFVSRGVKTNNKAAKAFGAVVKGFLPFRKTPANVLVRAMEYSPAGLVKTAVQTAQEVKAKKKGETTGQDITESLAKSLTGTGLFVLGFLLAKGDVLRTKEDDDKLDDFQQMRGAQNWSWVFADGSSVTLDWLAPYSIPLFMGAALNDLDGDEGAIETVIEIIRNISDPMLEMSMLSGIEDALGTVSDWSDTGAIWQFATNALLNLASRPFTNSLLRQAEQAWQDTRQTYYTDRDSLLSSNTQYALSKISASIPGWDYNTQDYIDAWGRKEYTGPWYKRVFDAFLNPTYTSSDNSTEVDAELERLYELGQGMDDFPNVLPQKASRSLNIGGGETMTPAEYESYSIERGERSLQLVKDLMASEYYEALSDAQKAETINELYKIAADEAKMHIQQGRGLEYTGTTKPEVMELSDPEAFLAAKAIFSTATGSDGSRDYEAIDKAIESLYPWLSTDALALLDSNSNYARLDDIYTASSMGINSETWYKFYDKYREVNSDDSLSAQERALQFAIWADEQGLSPARTNVLKEQFKFSGGFSVNAEKYERLRDAGLDSSEAQDVMDVLKNLPILDGKKEPTQAQRIQAIAEMNLSDEEMFAIIGYYTSDKASESAASWQKDGRSFADWAEYYT